MLKSVLKPEGSVMTGAASAAIIIAVYTKNMPDIASIRTADPHNSDVEAARKRSAWECAAVLGVLFLLTRDLGSFIIGGTVLTAVDLHTKHANGVHPATGTLAHPHDGNDSQLTSTSAYSLTDPHYDGAPGDETPYDHDQSYAA